MTRYDSLALLAHTPDWRCESLRAAAPDLRAALLAALEREGELLAKLAAMGVIVRDRAEVSDV